jgi:hypothetical protein
MKSASGAQDDFPGGSLIACGGCAARIGEAEIGVAGRVAGARFLEREFHAAGDESAHASVLTGKPASAVTKAAFLRSIEIVSPPSRSTTPVISLALASSSGSTRSPRRSEATPAVSERYCGDAHYRCGRAEESRGGKHDEAAPCCRPWREPGRHRKRRRPALSRAPAHVVPFAAGGPNDAIAVRACSPARIIRSPAATSANESEDDQEQHGPDRCRDDGSDNPGAEVDAKPGKQPTADERADDSNADIGDDTKAGAAHDLSGQPTGDETDQQDYEKTFSRHGDFPLASLRLTSAPKMLPDPHRRSNGKRELICSAG